MPEVNKTKRMQICVLLQTIGISLSNECSSDDRPMFEPRIHYPPRCFQLGVRAAAT